MFINLTRMAVRPKNSNETTLPSSIQTSEIDALLQEVRSGCKSRKLFFPQTKPEEHWSEESQSPSPFSQMAESQYSVSNLLHFPFDKQ